MRARDEARAVRGTGWTLGWSMGLVSLAGCAIGASGETFGSAASIGGHDTGDTSDTSDGMGGGGSDGVDGSGGQDGSATSAGPGGETDEPPPGSEICNGIDDDGDGAIDEDQPAQSCGVGSCEVTQPSCMGGVPQPCTPALPGGEVCNGLDDDCNGAIDDVQESCSTACGDGMVVCVGSDATCNGPAPQPESCNLLDDDCNGSFDEGVGGCRVGIHRSLNRATGEHFYTASLAEAQSPGFLLETANFYYLYSGAHAGLVPFHRCYNPGGFHLYTQDPACEGYVLEGVLGYIATGSGTAGSAPLYRLYLPANGDHFFTVSAAERDNAVATYGYIEEGVAGYVW